MTELLEFDPLTGLPNILSFELKLSEALAYYTEDTGLVGLIVIDLDRFKATNDWFGLAASNEVLKSVASLLQSCTRDPEIVYRLHSDEFAFLCIGTTPKRVKFLEKVITKEVSRLKVFSGRTDMGPFSVTTGTASCPGDGRRPTDLLQTAYDNLLRKKQQRCRGESNDTERSLQEYLQRDDMTGLLDARGFCRALERLLSPDEVLDPPISVIEIDIADFKSINDSFGCCAGDEVIRCVARALEARCMEEEAFVARFAGDSFLVALRAEEAGTQRFIDSIREQVESLRVNWQSFVIGPLSLHVGCAIVPRDGTTAEELLEAADRSMYSRRRRDDDPPPTFAAARPHPKPRPIVDACVQLTEPGRN